MARRRRNTTFLSKVTVTYKNGESETFTFLGKSTSGKSLKLSDNNGKIFYLPVKKLEMYEVEGKVRS